MSVRVIVALALLAALGAMLLVDVGAGGDGRAPDAAVPGSPVAAAPAGSPESCLPCHAAVVDEWRESMHAQAAIDPQFRGPPERGGSNDLQMTECIPCHASRPVFEYGIEEGTRVLARRERRHDGVDCLSCHGLPDGGVAATATVPDAACRPTVRAALSTDALCAPCHNQHQTHDEWRASPAAARGETCLSCHMPRVNRHGDEAGAPRGGRSHRFPGGRQKEFVLDGLSLSHTLDTETRRLIVEIANTFAGHDLPTDSRNRALDLVVTVRDALGRPVPPAEGVGVRHPGGETGTARLRFRNPYRSAGEPSTQIPAGESRRLAVPLPEDARDAVVELFYKLEPWIADDGALWSHRVEVPLPDGDG